MEIECFHHILLNIWKYIAIIKHRAIKKIVSAVQVYN